MNSYTPTAAAVTGGPTSRNWLRRAEAWHAGDLGLQVAAHTLKNLPARPDPSALSELAERWRPWRAVAARLLWNHYLNKPSVP